MKQRNAHMIIRHFKFACALVAGLFCVSSFAWAAPERYATVQDLEGTLMFQRTGMEGWKSAHPGDQLLMGDVVKTDAASKAKLLFHGQSEAFVEVRPATQMTLASVGSVDDADDTEIQLALGSVKVKADKLKGKMSRFEVKTPNSVVGIRGTEFEVAVP